MTEVTDPNKYSKRDLLLLLQLLHTAGLIDPNSVSKANSGVLEQISLTWYHHKSTKLSMLNGLDLDQPWSVDQVILLYNALLAQYPGKNTTTMADAVYSERIQQLETKLSTSQSQFDTLLQDV